MRLKKYYTNQTDENGYDIPRKMMYIAYLTPTPLDNGFLETISIELTKKQFKTISDHDLLDIAKITYNEFYKIKDTVNINDNEILEIEYGIDLGDVFYYLSGDYCNDLCIRCKVRELNEVDKNHFLDYQAISNNLN